MSSLFNEMMEEISEKDQQIADLEAKLAESENRVKDLEFRNKNLEHSLSVAPNANAGQRARIVELKGINHQLKHQLAEKEKEFEYQESMKILAVKNQNQTAIAELEKVRSEIEFKDKFGCVKSRYEVLHYINQQIKELKGEK